LAWQAFYSGTTAVVGMLKGRRIWVANAGDSRCTMGTMRDGKLVAQDLSIDQVNILPFAPQESSHS
jgi:serine/threonine protein phosphatase PrpC